MRFGTDAYGRYVVSRPHRESQRGAIEWYPFPSTRSRPAWIPNLVIAPFMLGHWLSEKTGILWEDRV